MSILQLIHNLPEKMSPVLAKSSGLAPNVLQRQLFLIHIVLSYTYDELHLTYLITGAITLLFFYPKSHQTIVLCQNGKPRMKKNADNDAELTKRKQRNSATVNILCFDILSDYMLYVV